MNENIELCSKLLLIWGMHRNDQEVMYDPEYERNSFIAKVLRKKLEVFKINVKLPDPLIMLIEICTGSNPGMSQLMLKEVLTRSGRKSIDSRDVEYEVTCEDFSFTYPMRFPILSLFPEAETKFNKMWDEQKDPETGSNRCDTPEWWMEIYG